MRRFSSICYCLFLLLIPLSGFAQDYYTINELREQAADGWHQTYTSYGRDINVEVVSRLPSVHEMPVLQVEPAFQQPTVTQEETGWVINIADTGIISMIMNDPDAVRDDAVKNVKWKRASTWFYDSFSMDTAYACENELTLGEAIENLKGVLDKAGIESEQYLLTQPVSVDIDNDLSVSSGEALLPGSYAMVFLRQMHGIPILCHALSGVENPKDNELMFWPNMIYNIRSTDSFSVAVMTLKETGILSDDIPLCSYSKIINTAEMEILAGHIRKVFDMDLGYVLYNMPGIAREPGAEWLKTAKFYAVPAWRMNCLYVSNPKKELHNYDGLDVPERGTTEYTTLIINAQTGEMQDYMNNRKGCADYTGFISWDEVGGDK